jgi:twitching motility protein PilT
VKLCGTPVGFAYHRDKESTMQVMPVAGEMESKVVESLGAARLFRGLDPRQLPEIAALAELRQYEAGEVLLREGDPPDGFLLILGGEVEVRVRHPEGEHDVEIARLGQGDTLGEVGLLLGQPRSATTVAHGRVHALAFPTSFFQNIIQRVPSVGLVLCQALARHLRQMSRMIPAPVLKGIEPSAEVAGLFPLEFVERHRVVPLFAEGSELTVGFVGGPLPEVVERARQFVPGMTIRSVSIAPEVLAGALRNGMVPPAVENGGGLPNLDALLRSMVTEGASDLHLAGRQRPRWRIDGEIREIASAPVLGEDSVLTMLGDAMPERNRREFDATNDTDFAHEIQGLSRFRVNVFRDAGGVGAVFRQIPATILTFDQLGLPEVVARFCAEPKGLVLVTGPTGSGKSTTLAAMVDAINRKRAEHIITLEDPIEFVHPSRKALVNQREVGPHTDSFARALRAALREDPDIVLVGEMRDLETIALALETANTGHLVFGTLHTATAITTVDRIVGLFPADQQNQIRSVLADVLKGVISQTLLRRAGGGRVAALEVLVVNQAVANLVREGKTHQIASQMQTSKALGNQMLNDALASLVRAGTVEYEEAHLKAVDKDDLERRLKRRSLVE